MDRLFDDLLPRTGTNDDNFLGYLSRSRVLSRNSRQPCRRSRESMHAKMIARLSRFHAPPIIDDLCRGASGPASAGSVVGARLARRPRQAALRPITAGQSMNQQSQILVRRVRKARLLPAALAVAPLQEFAEQRLALRLSARGALLRAGEERVEITLLRLLRR